MVNPVLVISFKVGFFKESELLSIPNTSTYLSPVLGVGIPDILNLTPDDPEDPEYILLK